MVSGFFPFYLTFWKETDKTGEDHYGITLKPSHCLFWISNIDFQGLGTLAWQRKMCMSWLFFFFFFQRRTFIKDERLPIRDTKIQCVMYLHILAIQLKWVSLYRIPKFGYVCFTSFFARVFMISDAHLNSNLAMAVWILLCDRTSGWLEKLWLKWLEFAGHTLILSMRTWAQESIPQGNVVSAWTI